MTEGAMQTPFRYLARKMRSALYRLARFRDGMRASAELGPHYPAFIQMIAALSKNGAIGVRGHPWRALDQARALRVLKPARIVELGSGVSTGLFAEYVHATPGATLVSVDESAHWAEVTRDGLRTAGLAQVDRVSIVTAERRENEAGSYYDYDFGDDIDLLYLDGPTVKVADGKKTPNQDVLMMFAKRIYPRAILVDGRFEIVRAIAQSDAAHLYEFVPAYSLRLEDASRLRGMTKVISTLHRSSLFIRVERSGVEHSAFNRT